MTRTIAPPLDEDAHDESEMELVDLLSPVRRGLVDRPPSYRDHPAHLSMVELRLASTRLGVSQYPGHVSGLLVGENPGTNTHPDLPLFPWPTTSSAGRLLAMSQLSAGQFLGSLYRRNLVDEHHWVRDSAARRARSIVTALFEQPRELRVVLCGMKVARAFGFKNTPWTPYRMVSRQTCVVIPSGLNKIYHVDPAAREKTGAWLRWAAGQEVPA